MAEISASTFSTPFGNGIVKASAESVIAVELPDISRTVLLQRNSSGFSSSRLTDLAADMLSRYFSGEPIEFRDIPVSFPGISPFRYRALDAIRNIPYGEVRSYRDIAVICGSPFSARAIGGAMASNPVPIIIPCHRIVAESGRLTGFSAPGGLVSKKVLLEMEGVEFKGSASSEQISVSCHYRVMPVS